MNDLRYDNSEMENFKEVQVSEWVKNGATLMESEQLFEDMITDINYSDPDIEVFSDFTISERIKQYSKR